MNIIFKFNFGYFNINYKPLFVNTKLRWVHVTQENRTVFMNKKHTLFFCLLILNCIIYCQEASKKNISKNIFAKVYGNFYTGMERENHSSAFEIRRAYFGLKNEINEHFLGEVKVDIGSPNDVSPYSLIRRYAYFKNAGMTYKKNNIIIKFGLIDLYHFKLQEKYWGHRYIRKSFQDEFGFGASADIGVSVRYIPDKSMNIDFTIMNGEGYKNLQTDDIYKYSVGLTLKSTRGYLIRTYFDYTEDLLPQITISGFVGIKITNFTAGIEYNHKINNNDLKDNNLYGVSGYMTYKLNNKYELFGRYDRLDSKIIHHEKHPWNIARDGSSIVTGIQYNLSSGIKMALNYQDWYPYAANLKNHSYIFINVEFVL